MTKPQFATRRSRDHRRQPLSAPPRRMGEVVGGTTAEVAAVCCCFPFSVVDFLVLTMYRVPSGLCRNAVRKKRRRRAKMPYHGGGGRDHGGGEESPAVAMAATAAVTVEPEVDKDVVAFDNEMWEKFAESGFWRNPSE